MSDSERPPSAPVGAESLPGVIDLYAAYDATKAVVDGGGEVTREQHDAYDSACEALHASRRYWREIRDYVVAAGLEAAVNEGEG
ncbi:MAG TPA: hypothetical protein VHC63_13310 [Acidimicrobiales bacterium]|nr:hypothetical protein [Acidimicrobiales bacterium]